MYICVWCVECKLWDYVYYMYEYTADTDNNSSTVDIFLLKDDQLQ